MTLKIPRHIADVMYEVLGAIRNGDTIEVVEDIWINSKIVRQKLGLKRLEQLNWLVEQGHLERREADGRGFEYDPVKVDRVAPLIKSGKIKLPSINSFYKKDAA